MFTGMKKVYTKAVGGIYNRQLVQDDDLSDKSILLLFGTLSVSLQGGFSMRKQNIKTSEELDRLRLNGSVVYLIVCQQHFRDAGGFRIMISFAGIHGSHLLHLRVAQRKAE